MLPERENLVLEGNNWDGNKRKWGKVEPAGEGKTK